MSQATKDLRSFESKSSRSRSAYLSVAGMVVSGLALERLGEEALRLGCSSGALWREQS